MDKLKMHSPDLTQDNIAKIRELFPGCVTEVASVDGKIRLAIDFELLRQELSPNIVEGSQERYRLDWPGKREAIAVSNLATAVTFRPDIGASKNFEATRNIFIEGDNLEALKLLQETYLGAVDLIYIDPPYNTGSDFVYPDSFYEKSHSYLKVTGQSSDDGDRLSANPELRGRIHSNWLSMMLTRLRLSRNLLSESGLIFISIDDNEIFNLRSICNEIFGHENFRAEICWRKKRGKDNSTTGFSRLHEYIVVYSKTESFNLSRLEMSEKRRAVYTNPDHDPKGEYVLQPAWASGMKRGPTYSVSLGDVHFPKRMWLYAKETLLAAWADGRLSIKGSHSDGMPNVYLKVYLSESKGIIPDTIWDDCGNTGDAVSEIKGIFDNEIPFDTPKPLKLLEKIIQIASSKNSLILDFFAGSGTTQAAVFNVNSADGGARRCINVQLPEIISSNKMTRHQFPNVAEVCKERIRRAGERILSRAAHPAWNKDVGFRALKIDTSNMADVYYTPDATNQGDLLAQVDSIKQGRTAEDLLFQVLVDWGVDLTLPIRRETVQGKTVFFVDENALVACFDTGVTEELVKELAVHEPVRVVFRDTGFVSDAVKINVEQIFRQLSPSTEVKAI